MIVSLLVCPYKLSVCNVCICGYRYYTYWPTYGGRLFCYYPHFNLFFLSVWTSNPPSYFGQFTKWTPASSYYFFYLSLSRLDLRWLDYSIIFRRPRFNWSSSQNKRPLLRTSWNDFAYIPYLTLESLRALLGSIHLQILSSFPFSSLDLLLSSKNNLFPLPLTAEHTLRRSPSFYLGLTNEPI